jgi:tetratricopeptide (TPR) repeat protein
MWSNLASLELIAGNYGEAETMFRRALAMQDALLGPEHPELFSTLSNLADCYRRQHRYAEAEPLFRRALEIGRVGSNLDLTSCLWSYALLLRKTKHKAEAAKLEEEARRMRAKDPTRFAVALGDLK